MAAHPTVHLREVTDDDLATFFEHQLDPEATRMAAFASRARDPFTAHWTRILADPTVVTRTVVVDGQVAGNVVCFGGPTEREVGYWIGRPYWDRGVATRALAQFLPLIATRPLYAHVARHNVGSRRVLEKCGFTLADEGVASDGVEQLVLVLP